MIVTPRTMRTFVSNRLHVTAGSYGARSARFAAGGNTIISRSKFCDYDYVQEFQIGLHSAGKVRGNPSVNCSGLALAETNRLAQIEGM